MLNSTHIFASPGNLRFPLSGLQKRRKQPKRYATLGKNLYKNILTRIETYHKIKNWRK
jgi:hypothetical protein